MGPAYMSTRETNHISSAKRQVRVRERQAGEEGGLAARGHGSRPTGIRFDSNRRAFPSSRLGRF